MTIEELMKRLTDATLHFQRKQELGELSMLEISHIKRQLEFAYSHIQTKAYSLADAYINRANANMNESSR